MLSKLRGGLTVCSYSVCAGDPFFLAPFTVIIAGTVVGTVLADLHALLFILAPLYVVALSLGFKKHRKPLSLVIGSIGVSLIFVHLISHWNAFTLFDFTLFIPAIAFQPPFPPPSSISTFLSFQRLLFSLFNDPIAYISLLGDWVGGALLGAAIFINWHALRRLRLKSPFRR